MASTDTDTGLARIRASIDFADLSAAAVSPDATVRAESLITRTGADELHEWLRAAGHLVPAIENTCNIYAGAYGALSSMAESMIKELRDLRDENDQLAAKLAAAQYVAAGA